MDIHSNFCYARGYETPRHTSTARSPEATSHRAPSGRKNVSVGGSNIERFHQLRCPLGPSASQGRKGFLASPAHSGEASATLSIPEGPVGPEPGCWPVDGRLFHRRMDAVSNRTPDCPGVPDSLPSRACMAADDAIGLDMPETSAAGAGTRRSGHRSLETLPMAAYKKTPFAGKRIWFSSTKVGSCSSRTSLTPGHPGGRPLDSGIGIDDSASRPSPLLPSLLPGAAWDFMPGFTTPTSPDSKSSLSCGTSFDTCGVTWSCCGTAARSIGIPSSAPFVRDIRVSMFIPSRLMLRNSTRMNSSGPRPSGLYPTRPPEISQTSGEGCIGQSEKPEPPKRCFGLASTLRISPGRKT